MHIGLFGGTFDPPHKGHQQVARFLVDQDLVDQVWFVPVFEHPWAGRLGKEMSSYSDRLAMLHCLAERPHFQVAEYHGVSYTLDQLEYFKSKFPEHQFSWVMGSEYLPKFGDFLTTHPRLVEHAMIIYPRAGYPKEPLYPNMTLPPNCPEIAIASTEIRESVLEGKSVEDLVAPEIDIYIREHSLYTS